MDITLVYVKWSLLIDGKTVWIWQMNNISDNEERKKKYFIDIFIVHPENEKRSLTIYTDGIFSIDDLEGHKAFFSTKNPEI